MSDNPQSEESIVEEFRRLGKNLVSVMQTAWETPERKRIQDEFTTGLNELGTTLRREVDQFSNSSTSQRIKEDVEQLGDKIRSSEATTKVRDELIHALQMANKEIQRVVENWAEGQSKTEPNGVNNSTPDEANSTQDKEP